MVFCPPHCGTSRPTKAFHENEVGKYLLLGVGVGHCFRKATIVTNSYRPPFFWSAATKMTRIEIASASTAMARLPLGGIPVERRVGGAANGDGITSRDMDTFRLFRFRLPSFVLTYEFQMIISCNWICSFACPSRTSKPDLRVETRVDRLTAHSSQPV